MLCETAPEQSTAGSRVAVELLAEIPLFRQLKPDLKHTIGQHCRCVRFRTGELVVRQSEPATNVYFVVQGHLRSVFYSINGKEVAFEELKTGDYFGQHGAIDSLDQFTSVMALNDVSLLSLPCRVFRQIVANHAGVSHAVTLQSTLMIRQLSQRICEYSTLGVGARVRAEVLRLACANERGRNSCAGAGLSPDDRCNRRAAMTAAAELANRPAEPIIIDDFPTHADFANRISTHREAVTREINRLEREGVIERRDGEFIVADVGGLQRLVNTRSRGTLH